MIETRPRGAVMTAATLFRLAAGAIAVHVIDDNFAQPNPGTTAGDHLVSGLVPLAVLALVDLGCTRACGPASRRPWRSSSPPSR